MDDGAVGGGGEAGGGEDAVVPDWVTITVTGTVIMRETPGPDSKMYTRAELVPTARLAVLIVTPTWSSSVVMALLLPCGETDPVHTGLGFPEVLIGARLLQIHCEHAALTLDHRRAERGRQRRNRGVHGNWAAVRPEAARR